MKITYSPLVASCSGTTANAVAATWKGINYIRQHVIPANPNTAAQQLVRNALTRCVTLWRSLHANIKSWLNTYGVDYRMSGFNVFMQKCRTLEQAGSALKPVPDNPYCPAPASFAGAAGGAGEITVTWTDNSPAAYSLFFGFVRLVGTNVFLKENQVDADLGTMTFTGLDAGEDYDCYGFFQHTTDSDCGTSAADLAVTAGA